MYQYINFIKIIQDAWYDYDESRKIKYVDDISAKVSTNHVYRIRFDDGENIIAKLSYFGKFENFLEDHSIISALANNLPSPFENFLAKSLTKFGQLYVYHHQDSVLDAWVVFYNQIKIDQKPDRKQSKEQISILGSELAYFHLACSKVKNTLPRNFKKSNDDIHHLLEILETDRGKFEHRGHEDTIRKQCDLFMENSDKLGFSEMPIIPVFVDWNIGNFSVRNDYTFFSRWDYDWFRMSTRMMDFYFFSRVCSELGDKTVFSYLLVFFIGTILSLFAKYNISVSDYFLPTAFSVVFIHWLGPKLVVPLMYFNAVITSYLWGNPIEDWPLWFLYGIPETLFAFFSWFLFRKLYNGKYWLPNTQNLILFLIMGVLIPSMIEIFLLQGILVWTGAQSQSTFWLFTVSNIISEFTTTFFITLPALYYITPWLMRKNILHDSPTENIPNHTLKKSVIIELSVIYACLLVLVVLIEFQDFWYVYGFFSLYVAIRFGFNATVITNFYILLITYILPKLLPNFGIIEIENINDVINIFLGVSLLSIFSTLTGRVISDLKITELKLKDQNIELEKVNVELDHFVYSVSHDLTAPLKTILGLVNISRLTKDNNEIYLYLSKIEKSVKKLETFITETLDYSRNKRQQLISEPIDLRELMNELLEDLLQIPEAKFIQVNFQLHKPEIYQDKARLKIILSNVLTNAVNFQKSHAGHEPYIKISSYKSHDNFQIKIEDNGIGIKTEQLESIFQMFYGGHEKSNGSGLGLYIVKEAIYKINGSISVESEYGKGSTFILNLKDFNP